jgi:flagellar assembly factor FliW
MPSVESTRFGAFEVADEAVLVFPRSIVGFSESRRYALVARSPDDPFFWLHSLDEAAVAFPVTDPWAFHPDFALEIDDEDVELLDAPRAESLLVLAIVAVGADASEATINLLAPVAINLERRVAAQVLNRLEASARAPLFGAGAVTPRAGEVEALTLIP